MFDDAAKIMNQGLLYPLVFIAGCIVLYIFIGSFIYFRLLSRWVPEILAKLAGFRCCTALTRLRAAPFEARVPHSTATGNISSPSASAARTASARGPVEGTGPRAWRARRRHRCPLPRASAVRCARAPRQGRDARAARASGGCAGRPAEESR